jgi:hypothetical protein
MRFDDLISQIAHNRLAIVVGRFFGARLRFSGHRRLQR